MFCNKRTEQRASFDHVFNVNVTRPVEEKWKSDPNAFNYIFIIRDNIMISLCKPTRFHCGEFNQHVLSFSLWLFE